MTYSLRPHGLYNLWNSQARKLEWVAFPISRGSSQPRDVTQVSRIAGGFFISRATREALYPHQIVIMCMSISIGRSCPIQGQGLCFLYLCILNSPHSASRGIYSVKAFWVNTFVARTAWNEDDGCVGAVRTAMYLEAVLGNFYEMLQVEKK